MAAPAAGLAFGREDGGEMARGLMTSPSTVPASPTVGPKVGEMVLRRFWRGWGFVGEVGVDEAVGEVDAEAYLGAGAGFGFVEGAGEGDDAFFAVAGSEGEGDILAEQLGGVNRRRGSGGFGRRGGRGRGWTRNFCRRVRVSE